MADFDHFIGTRAVTGAQSFDVEKLSAWLAANLQGFAGPLSADLCKGGHSNTTYK